MLYGAWCAQCVILYIIYAIRYNISYILDRALLRLCATWFICYDVCSVLYATYDVYYVIPMAQVICYNVYVVCSV